MHLWLQKVGAGSALLLRYSHCPPGIRESCCLGEGLSHGPPKFVIKRDQGKQKVCGQEWGKKGGGV